MLYLRYLTVILTLSAAAMAQTFSSGSTGADGTLDLSAGDLTVVLPASGVLNYTTVNIPVGRTLTFQNNLTNTAVVVLAQGTVNVAGTINIQATGSAPGPGGFYGGAPGQPGLGPGGGQPVWTDTSIENGTWVGPLSLVPNIGGSGGGGISACVTANDAYGGHGGGAITIASSTSISMTGGILADPSNGIQVKNTGCNFPFNFTYGASGAIRLVSNAVSVSGNLSAAVARLEAPLGNVAYTGSGVAPVISPINPEIVPTKPPSLTILSIGGYPVPSYSGSSFSSIDLLLPNQMADPIPVVVQGTNLPVGSPVAVNFSGSPNATSTTANLAGTSATSTATVYISNLNRAAVSYLFVSATFDPTLIAQYVPQKGPNAVSKIELAAAIAQKTQYRFFRLDGSQVPFDRLSAQLRHALGF
jgi:hypothetical protein